MTNVVQIWINDDILDVFPGTVIAQTFRAFDLSSFNTTWRTYTNTFKVPHTDRNDTILGHARLVQSDSSNVYSANTCRIIQNGVEIVNRGTPIIKEFNEGYSVFVLSGLSFFDTIGSKRLTDLDFTTATGNGLNGTSRIGKLFPVLNYGRFTSNDLEEEYWLPSFAFSAILDAIYDDAGFAKSGSIFSDTKYQSTIVPYGRSAYAYGGDFVAKRLVVAEKTSSQVILNANLGTTPITFPTILFQGEEEWFDGTTGLYEPLEPDASTGDRLCFIQVEITLDITVTGGTVDVVLNGSSFGDLLTGVGTGTHTHTTADNVESAKVNTVYSLRFDAATGTPDVTVNSGLIKITPINQPPFGSAGFIYYNLLLPELSQKDFLKDFSQRFGQHFQDKDGTIYHKSIDDIISDTANAVDWSSKRIRQKDVITYTPTNYGIKNTLSYTNIDLNIAQDFGSAFFNIANQNLKPEQLIKSPFSSSQTRTTSGVFCAQVPIFDGTESNFMEDFKFNPGLRVLLIRNKYSSEPSLSALNGGIPDIGAYQVAYFDDPLQSSTCKYQQTLDEYYPLLIESLQKYKMVTREYNLTEADIANLDFFLPIFDTDSYYVLDTVGPYVPGQRCKVKMMKI